MSVNDLALAQTGLTQIISGIFSGFLAPPSISLSSPTLAPPAGYYNDSAQTIMSGGIPRYYAVNIPTDYGSQAEKVWPLIIDYHGNTDTPHDQWDNSQYWSYDAGQGYLVAYPLGVNLAWQGASYAEKGVDDLQFTTDLLNHLKSTYNIDSNRVYASGKSVGGGFVDLLACSDNGDDFAAFAMAAAALYTDTSSSDCSKKRAIIEVHGQEDQTIPYNGGEGLGGDVPNISAWVGWWGDRDCGPNVDVQTSQYSGYSTSTYSCGGPTNVFEHYKVFDLGHCWPSSTGKNFDATSGLTNCDDDVLDFTSNVLDFFGQWDLTNAPQN